MAKTLDNAMSHTLRRGHISGDEFAMLAQYHVIMITPFSTYVTNRHPLPPRIYFQCPYTSVIGYDARCPFLRHSYVARIASVGPAQSLWSERTEYECDILG